MKKNYIIYDVYRLSLVFLLIGVFSLTDIIITSASAQERSRIRLNYRKNSDESKTITSILFAGRGKNMVYLENDTIILTASANDSTVELARVQTDAKGVGLLQIEKGYQFPTDEDGFTVIEAAFEGNGEYKASSNDLLVKDLNFDISFEVVDSVKTVSVKATETGKEGNPVPVEGLYVYVGVDRLFSILPVGEVYSSKNGLYTLQFPDDIPGDSTGTFTVIARIEDNDFYGSVEKKASVAWGLPVSYKLKPPQRKLWTNEAPLWMIFSIFIVLTGAWFHFFLSIYKLSKIKKVSNVT